MRFTQPLRGTAEKLFEFSQDMPVIDTHEHLPIKEEYYVNMPTQFGNLFNPYCAYDLYSAGMDFPRDQWAAFVCISDDWDDFKKHWDRMKYTSYARALRISMQKYFGVDDFTRENYLDVVLKGVRENQKPGVYQRILREDCNIEWSIPCSGALPDKDDPILKGNISSPTFFCTNPQGLAQMEQDTGCESIRSLGAFLEASRAWMIKQKEAGAIEFKSKAFSTAKVDRDEAVLLFARVLSGESLTETEAAPLMSVVREEVAKVCAEIDLPLALHTGVWGDYRETDIEDVIGLASRNPDTRLDAYHLGIPNTRKAIQIVKNFQNVYLNLCWSHVVASDMVTNTLKEAFDMIPINKIFAFGADYVYAIEKVYGHLYIARENVAIALADRVDRNHLGLDEARMIMKMWFYDNPKEFYRI